MTADLELGAAGPAAITTPAARQRGPSHSAAIPPAAEGPFGRDGTPDTEGAFVTARRRLQGASSAAPRRTVKARPLVDK